MFQGLLPKGTNQTPPEADWKLYFQAAVEAFDANRILILIDERQAETLDDEVEVGPQTTVTFMRLVPLVGG